MDSQKIIEKVSYPQMEVDEVVEEPSTEGIVESSLNEEELLLQPAAETVVDRQPEETAKHTGVHRTVSRHSDSVTTRRQVIRRHIQVSMVKKIHDEEARSSEEEGEEELEEEIEEESEEEASPSSDEHPSEEVEFKPMIREGRRVIRTAVRRSARDRSARKVIRTHEKETHDVPLPLEVSGLPPQKIVVEEEVVSESPVLAEVYTEPDLYLETGGEKAHEEPKVIRFVQRQDEVPSSRRQVIRSVVRETFTTTAREGGKNLLIEDQNAEDTSSSPISSEDEGDQVLFEDVAGGGLQTRLAIRGDERNITHRQVYRVVDKEVSQLMEYGTEAKPEEAVVEEVLPEPSHSAQVEEEPDYLEHLVEEHNIKGVASVDEEPTIRRTILRTPEDAITRRQVIRRRVQQTESVVLHIHSEGEEEESSSEEEEVPVAEINGVYENGLNGEEGVDLEIIREDLPRKFDHLRTAVRREEHYPLSRRQVYRKKDISVAKEEVKKQMKIDKDKTVESGSKSHFLLLISLFIYLLFV